MGYAFMTGFCWCCNKLFTFNPRKVPSIRIKGKREPICQACIGLANKIRAENNLPLWPVADDAYTYCDESELS